MRRVREHVEVQEAGGALLLDSDAAHPVLERGGEEPVRLDPPDGEVDGAQRCGPLGPVVDTWTLYSAQRCPDATSMGAAYVMRMSTSLSQNVIKRSSSTRSPVASTMKLRASMASPLPPYT